MRLEALSLSSPNALMPTPKRWVRSQERFGAGTVSRRKLARAGFAQHPHGRASFPESGAKRRPPQFRHCGGKSSQGREFVQLGEISVGRQALESARVARGTLATLRALTNQQRRSPVPREPIPEGLATAMPESPFDLDFDRFISNIRRAKRGAAPGLSSMTTEHLHPLFENDASLVAFFRVAVLFSRGQVPPNALEGLKFGRITALEKPDGGVRVPNRSAILH